MLIIQGHTGILGALRPLVRHNLLLPWGFQHSLFFESKRFVLTFSWLSPPKEDFQQDTPNNLYHYTSGTTFYCWRENSSSSVMPVTFNDRDMSKQNKLLESIPYLIYHNLSFKCVLINHTKHLWLILRRKTYFLESKEASR